MENKKSENPCWQRIEAVLEHSRIHSINAFARHIGINRGENLYQIRRGNNGISKALAKAINDRFPEISLGWLLSGEGNMLVGEEEQKEGREAREAEVVIRIILELG